MFIFIRSEMFVHHFSFFFVVCVIEWDLLYYIYIFNYMLDISNILPFLFSIILCS